MATDNRQETKETPYEVQVDIIAGFLGSGKTTLINKLLDGAVAPSETVLIENEFGEVSIDDDLLSGSGMETKTLSSGCICCTLRGSFVAAFPELIKKFHPKRIIIEPTGMASPTELLSICADATYSSPIKVNSLISVVNAANIERLIKLHVPAFDMQFESVNFIVLTHLEDLTADQIQHVVDLMHETVGSDIPIIAKPLEAIDALQLLSLAEEALAASGLADNAKGYQPYYATSEADSNKSLPTDDTHDTNTNERHHEHGKDHHHEGRHHDGAGHDGRRHDEHDHAHHHHDGHDHAGHDHAHHHHDGHDHEGHDHAHHHDSTQGVTSFAFAPQEPFSEAELEALATALEDGTYGTVLRAKGFLEQEDAGMILFEQVYGSYSIGSTGYTKHPKFVVIGKDLDVSRLEAALKGTRIIHE